MQCEGKQDKDTFIRGGSSSRRVGAGGEAVLYLVGDDIFSMCCNES